MGQAHRDPLYNHHSSQNFVCVSSLFCQESQEIKNSQDDCHLHLSRTFRCLRVLARSTQNFLFAASNPNDRQMIHKNAIVIVDYAIELQMLAVATIVRKSPKQSE